MTGARIPRKVALGLACALLALLAVRAPAAWAQAATPGATVALHRYPGADLAAGEKLLREHACASCHVRKVGGDGTAIYRPQLRIKTPAALESMVERCNTELNLGLFPEDVLAIAAVLQRDHYRFAAQP